MSDRMHARPARLADDPGRSLGLALQAISDYERAALDHPAVHHVKVIGGGTRRSVPLGSVEVRIRGRFFLPVPENVVREVHLDLVARKPIIVALRTRSGLRSFGGVR